MTPAPRGEARTLVAAAEPIVLRPESEPVDVLTLRTVAYLPQGLAYGAFAPFPWQSSRLSDLAIVPEMLVWYVIVAAAIATLIRWRERRRALFVVAGFSGGLLLLLSLVEGNAGTLYRHRAMIIAWAVLLSAPTFASLVRSPARALPGLRSSSEPSTADVVSG